MCYIIRQGGKSAGGRHPGHRDRLKQRPRVVYVKFPHMHNINTVTKILLEERG